MDGINESFFLGVSAVSAALLSLLGTRAVLDFAARHSMLDVPNERSSHRVPTPRGGGLAIAVTVGIALLVAMLAGLLSIRTGLAFLCGGSIIAVVGWIDDRRGLPVRLRLAAHFCAAILAVALLHWEPAQARGSFARVIVDIGAIVWLVWMTNLYNFMDGIDGLAAVEAIVVGASAAIMLAVSGALGLSFIAIVVAGAAAGFGWYNRPPARIFMGDVGSGLLGFLFGCLAVASAASGRTPAYVWPLLLAVFIADATVTLLRRVIGKRKWYTAHREHAYQRLVQHGWRHGQVDGAVTTIDIALALLAYFSLAGRIEPYAAMGAAAALIVMAYAAVERVAARPFTLNDHDA